MKPIAPVAMETSSSGHVRAIAATMTAMAPKRSTHSARLKKSHQTTSATKPASPAITPYAVKSGLTSGRPKRASH